ncbi:hypothetical protein FD755_005542 [Muntiacus reevesi]|uniref:Vomeronasal type-1 receptor n=1 Tax=Muntiacus reevesi TaxID=9886 RepID=A0A5J5MTV6_MUNRE|nr:hypothetical protein FD755_005542 [Muntiacus reevesi]
MLSSDAILEVFFISQICIGLMGNSVLFKLKNVHFHNSLSPEKLIPDVLSSFGVRHFLDDVGCKAALFIHRVTRGLSISITVSPVHSKWAWLKSKLYMCIYPSFLFFWVINMLIYIHIIKSVVANLNFTIVGSGYSTRYCQTNQLEHHYYSMAFLSIIWIQDLLFVVLMTWSNLYMVTLLYKHRRRAQHNHSPSLSPQPSPEIQATHIILLLVSCFVFFFFSDNFMTLYLFYRHEKNWRLKRTNGIISSCFPMICPFVLMKNNKIVSKCISSISKMRMTFSRRTLKI